MPVGFTPWAGPRIYGAAASPLPTSTLPERPAQPCDHFAFDQKQDAAAWRLTGELLNRAQHD